MREVCRVAAHRRSDFANCYYLGVVEVDWATMANTDIPFGIRKVIKSPHSTSCMLKVIERTVGSSQTRLAD